MDTHHVIQELFGRSPALLGVLHVPALPGTPKSRLTVAEIVAHVVAEGRRLEAAGFDGLVIENMHDRPYVQGDVGPEIVAAMAVVGAAVAAAVELPLGVQVLAGANRQALAVALACGASFVRVEGFVFAHVGDEGLHTADAGELLRYRKQVGAEHLRIFADVKKKHSAHSLTADVDLVETAQAAQFFLADGVIVSGSATGQPTSPHDLQAVAGAVDIPTLVGSGVTADNVATYMQADALIVGSYLKEDGRWDRPLDGRRVDALVQGFHRAAEAH